MKTIVQAAAAACAVLCCAPGTAAAGTGWLDGIAGKPLMAIDGSSVLLVPREGGLTRALTAPDGSVQKTAFSFMNDTLGTVADARDSATVVGYFRDTDAGLSAQFADGHTEALAANAEGGLSMILQAPDGSTYCMAWYPKGHVFDQAEREAALADYARRLGLALPGPKAASAPAGSACAMPAPAREAAIPAAASAAKPAATLVVPAASLAAPKAVLVRASAVHLIDGDPAATPAIDGGLPDRPGASDCLSVDSDGHHWGFRNRCDAAVQFAYCLKDGGDLLTGCESGRVPGSVAANGFAALLADKTLSETDAQHDFRWVACRGGAGEVVPQLDRTNPPSGRCIRANAS